MGKTESPIDYVWEYVKRPGIGIAWNEALKLLHNGTVARDFPEDVIANTSYYEMRHKCFRKIGRQPS